jgi:ATP-binding cassette subfamily B protein
MLGAFKAIWAFAGKERGNIRKSVLVGLMSALFNAVVLWAIYVVVTALASGSTDASVALQTLLLMAVSIVGRIATQYFSQLQVTRASYFMVANQRLTIGERLIGVPMGYFNQNRPHQVAAIATTTLDDIENLAPIALVNMLGGFLNTVVFAVMLLVFDWRIGALACLGILLFLLLTLLMERRAHSGTPQRQAAQADLVDAVLETIQGMAVVKAFNLSRSSGRKVDAAVEKSHSSNWRLEAGMAPFVALQQLTLNIVSLVMVAASIWMYFQGSMLLANCLVLIIAAFMVFDQLKVAGSAMASLRIVQASIEKAGSLDGIPRLTEGSVVQASESHEVRFTSVSFSYGQRQVLTNVSLTIPHQKLTAIVGPSGAGKTTLAMLIARFWDVDKGCVSIGGIDVRDYSLDSLMSMVSAVFQDVYLFNDSIENNIRFGNPEASHTDVLCAAQRACCDDFISRMPEGYETVIGEKGATLSGGERQRIAIARALLKDAPIVIFDEATANVDPESEDRLRAAIEELTRNKTVIMIAHRLKTVRNADNILVIANGSLMQQGNHDKLVAQEGIYANFVASRKRAIGWRLDDRREELVDTRSGQREPAERQ